MDDPDSERLGGLGAVLDGIPVLWLEPARDAGVVGVALWLPFLGGTKQDALPALRTLAGAGFVAVSLDPWQHGDRAQESAEQLRERVFGNFRRYMWPILGQTTLDALRVVDWALERFGAGPRVVAGGVSMGGDVAVALAGADPRVSRVGAVVATPDWTRPGMRDLADPSRELPRGQADAYARWFYAHLDPQTHLEAYARGPAIAFECGDDDTHVPPDGAVRFQRALADAYPEIREHVRVTRHPGLGHLEAGGAPELTDRAIAWLTAALA